MEEGGNKKQFSCFSLWTDADALFYVFSNCEIPLISFISECARIYPLFFVGTRLMSRIGKSRQSRSLFTGRRTFSTMKYLPRATTILRNLSCTWHANLLGEKIIRIDTSQFLDGPYGSIISLVIAGTLIFTLLQLLPLHLLKYKLIWLHSNSKNSL